MRSAWLPYDEMLDEDSHREVKNLMRIFLYIIPSIAVVLATVSFIFGYINIALTTLTVPVFCLISMYYLNKGQINTAMIVITTVMLISTSFICFFGGGIHEVGVIIFPVIVFFSSLVMNIRGVIITTSLVVLCLALIVLEEQHNIYPSDVPATSWVDLAVALSVLIIHTFMTFSFSNITKNNLRRITDELQSQKRYRKEIVESLDEKTQLLRLVHHRVKNNLLLINSLIELEAYGQPEIKQEFKEISDSIHTIARAHDPLYHTEDYKQVSIKPYLEKLIASFAQSRMVIVLEVEIDEYLMFHEKALLLGIVLQKILVSIRSQEVTDLAIQLKCIGKNGQLKVVAKNGSDILIEEVSLVELLTKQIKGKLKMINKGISIDFPVND